MKLRNIIIGVIAGAAILKSGFYVNPVKVVDNDIRTKCRHYYFSQEICGKQNCRKVRTTKKHLHELFPEWY